MVSFNNILIVLVVSCLLIVSYGQENQGGANIIQGEPHVSQRGPHENEGRIRCQMIQGHTKQTDNEDISNSQLSLKNWTTCDFTVTPTISCHNCNTRLICKPIGGLLKACDNPLRPFCNLGICSSIPRTDCL